MALRKPSDLFQKKETSGVFESPEVSFDIAESYDKFRNNFDKVNNLSEKVEVLSQELSEKMTRTDLENAMYSQLMILDENFKSIRNQIKGLNKEDLKEFKVNVSNLSEIVGNLVENEIPKYKKQITNNEVRIGDKFDQLKEVVEENIVGIRNEIDVKVNDIAEVIDTNLEYFNNQLQETSSEVKKTSDTYNKLSKIVESKVSKENEKLEEYSQVIQSLHEAFIELEKSFQEETSTYNQIIEEKFANISSDVKSTIHSIDEEVNTIKDKVSSDILNIKADVVINEQHIKNVDKYLQENYRDLVELKEEVFGEIEKLPLGNLQENLERLEKKIDYIKETYSKIEPEVIVKEVIKEGLLNEPPDTKNSDPLTPLDQKFVTLDQLQKHYSLFINRIQQQLSTLGGGGETQLRYLDDIVGIATNASAYDGKFLKYNHSIGKFVFDNVDISSDSWVDGSNGPYTFGSVGIGTTNPTSALTIKNGDISLDDGGTFTTTLQTITPTDARTISLPDATGTIALVAGSSGQLLYNLSGAVAGTSVTFDATTGTRHVLPFGYGTGAGGTITQATNKSTGVTLNTRCGQITMNGANLVTNTAVTFTLTNSQIAATDVLMLNHASGGTLGTYSFVARCAAGSATIAVRNVTAGDLAEAVVIRFAIIKATTT